MSSRTDSIRVGVPTGTAEGSSRPGTFAALRSRNYRVLWLGGVIAYLAVMAQSVARSWLALRLTGTNAGLGGVLLGFGIAMLVVSPWAGVAADRMPKRRILVASMTLLFISAAWIGLAVVFDVIEYWMLVLAGAVQAVGFALYVPARMAFMSELVDASLLSNAIVLGQMGAEAMRVIGPAVAGVLIGTLTSGLEATFLSCAVLCGIAALTMTRLPVGRPIPGRPARSPRADLVDGVKYVRRNAPVRLLSATLLAVVVVSMPYIAFLPAVADGVFDAGSVGFSVLAAASALGAVVTGLLTARPVRRSASWRRLTVSGLTVGLSIVALALAPSFPVAVAVLLVIGGASLALQTISQSLLLGLSSLEYHGRIQSIVMLGFSGFGVAALPLGLLADAIGLRTTLAFMGGTVLIIMVGFIVGRSRLTGREPLALIEVV